MYVYTYSVLERVEVFIHTIRILERVQELHYMVMRERYLERSAGGLHGGRQVMVPARHSYHIYICIFIYMYRYM